MSSDDFKFTEAGISRVLVHAFGMFPPRRWLAVENVSWGLLPWEADLLLMSKSKYLTEVEIKISVADLRRDQEKPKHRERLEVRPRPIYIHRDRFWRGGHMWLKQFLYAMPEAVWGKVAHQPPIPADAGVIVIYRDRDDSYRSRIVRKPRSNPHALALRDSEAYELARLGVLRYWDRMKA